MTDYTNGYFHMMKDIGTGYENAKNARKVEKDALTKANDWTASRPGTKEKRSFSSLLAPAA